MALFNRRGGSPVWSVSGKNGHRVGVPKMTFMTQFVTSPPQIAALQKLCSITQSASGA